MPAVATPTREAPALPPKVLLYRGSMAAESKVDGAAGTMNGVSLMTAELQPRGYPMFCDGKTLTTFHASLGDALKGYLKHSWADRTGEEIGLWGSFRIVGSQLLADFAALDAFKEFSGKSFKTLFELAKKAPAEFGASAVFSYTLAWVRENGSEVPTEAAGWRWNSELGDYELLFEPSVPADAVRQIPSVRVVESFSCDFVDVPAANRGLFSAADLSRPETAHLAKPIDAPAKGISPASTSTTPLMDIKTLQAEFGKNPAHLSRAVALFSANEKLTVAELRATITNEEQVSELTTLRTEHGAFKADLGKIDAAGFKAKDGKTGVDVVLADVATFKAKAGALDTAELALKAAGFEAKDGKTATDLVLAAHKKLTADMATLRAGGTVPVETGSGGGDGGSSTGALTRAAFMALSPAERLKFSKAGGKVIDPSNN